MPSTHHILKRLKAMGSPENVEGMARYGIKVTNTFGVPVGSVKLLAKELGRDHALALVLWKTGNRDARILAAFVADPKVMTPAQMDSWVRDFDSWDVCDGCAIHLFRKSPHAWAMAWKWARKQPEFVRRAGFAMFAALAVHDKKAADETFLEALPLIEDLAVDGRNFVKKAVNWALRQIGKRNAALRKAAIEVSARLAERPEAAARWVGKDALRELSASSRSQLLR